MAKARWIFHRDGVKKIRKLKSGDGDFLFQPALTEKTPSMLLGMPLHMSEYQKNTWSASEYVGILGNFDFYQIALALDMQFQVLDQLYAESNQVGIIGRMEIDAMPVISEAFCRIQLSA